MRRLGWAVLVAALSMPGTSQAPPQPITALAPIEVVLDGYRELVGVAVGVDGTAYVSDRGAGTILAVSAAGDVSMLLRGLDRPAGLAFDADGRLLVAEEGAGRIVRREPSGTLTTIATGIKTPRWLAAAANGDIYVSANRLDEPDGLDTDEGRVIVRVSAAGAVGVVARGIRRLEGLAFVTTDIVAATKGLESEAEAAGALLRYPVLADGTLGAPAVWISAVVKEPVGVALDHVGALYVGAKEMAVPVMPSNRVVGKVHSDGHVTGFAAGLEDPQGVGLAPDGSLYLADGKVGRLLRFRAPSAPGLMPLPEFTNQRTVTVSGTAELGARIAIALEGNGDAATAITDSVGTFASSITLERNVLNLLWVFATGHAGEGLTSAPAQATILHDDIEPDGRIVTPGAGAFVRGTVVLEASASDTGSGVSSVTFAVGAQAVGTVANADPTRPLTAEFPFNSVSVSDGAYTYTATARDRAGNIAAVGQSLIVDNTPPDTTITAGPSGTISETTATFAFTGTDNLTPPDSLVFAWRLDGGPWSAFGSTAGVTVSGLIQGPHTFEVKARDLAGNEDPTPAERRFVNASLRVTITDPVNGASVSSGLLLVRGTVEAGGPEVGVAVNGVPAAIQGTSFAALVPVAADTAILTAVATTADGSTASHTVTLVVVSPPGVTRVPTLAVLPESGVAPLTARFSASVDRAVTIALDFDGDGKVDFIGGALDAPSFTYTEPGLYVPTVTITDTDGVQFTARAVVNVLDRGALDALLKAKWNGMKGALMRGDIDAALGFFTPLERDRFRTLFTLVGARIAQVATDMQDIELIYAREGRAKYRLPRTQTYGGQLVTLTYYVYFIQDTAGAWTIESF